MKKLFTGLLVGFTSVVLTASGAMAAEPVRRQATADPLGVDVSWPQCDQRLAAIRKAFVIVGVNGGLATTTNPCLKDQLVWARQTTGHPTQEKLQLYVNTGNPGGLGTPSWPNSTIDPAGTTAPNPHGVCDGSDSLACAWQYGWNRSLEDIRDRFQPAALGAHITPSPAAYLWWLDVETENTWKLSGTAFDSQSNVAVLEGMTAYFQSVGARVGLYAFGEQWNQIVGSVVGPASNLNGLPNWRLGGANLDTAKAACLAPPLTPGGRIHMTQIVIDGLDYNYSCI
ncbi:MAG TPA: hypothetical protein VMR98_03185 [Candidatus Polarisedimenticolaceae bacterium]|nr:hypothetical protein [Candidatus Polarisedimenticolaceae bacterium]